MATKTRGYDSYHGRGNAGKVILSVVLILVILGAVGFFIVQNYMVYDAEGNAHLEMPFLQKKEPAPVPVEPEDVEIEILEPEIKRPVLRELHAAELRYGCLWWNSDYVLTLAPEDMMIDTKRFAGGVTYDSGVAGVPYKETGDTRNNLTALLNSEKYAVARMACFCDSLFEKDDTSVALMRTNGVRWYDGVGYGWINPASSKVQTYLIDLAKEMVEMGFDEILLDYFSYPTTGDYTDVPLIREADKEQVLLDFVTALREALPETVVISAVLRSEIRSEFGLSEKLLLENFDRIYVEYGRDAADLTAAAEQWDSNYVAQIVPMVYAAPEQGSYLKLWRTEE